MGRGPPLTDVPDARRRRRRGDWLHAEAGDAQYREARRRIPSGELGVERLPVVAADAQSIFAAERAHHRQHHIVSVHEAAGRTAAALDLND